MSTPSPPPALDRAGRKACWQARDAFFQCLNVNGVSIPPEGPAAAAKGTKGEACSAARERYEEDCPKSWVDYFNKRRVLEIRQRMTVDAAQRQQDADYAQRAQGQGQR